MGDTPHFERRTTPILSGVIRVVLGLLILFCCVLLFRNSAKAGFSRLLQTNSIIQSRVAYADSAIKVTPNDPEAHYTRALALVNLERLEEAVTEFKEAVRLRPHHYYEWLDLGVTLDRLDDQTGAEEALKRSIQLAPQFAQPHWQLGNLLFRQGRFSEAFVELRFAAGSNPKLNQTLIELAWAASGGDISTFEGMVNPQNAHIYLEMAEFLSRQGMGDEAARHLQKAGTPLNPEDLGISRTVVYLLLVKGQFAAAYSSWAAAHGIKNSPNPNQGFVNGNFIEPIQNDDPGFGWQLPKIANVSRSIDPVGPVQNSHSILIEYSGESEITNDAISELLLLEPNSRYSVSFMARTEKLISGGPPVIVITDISNKERKLLGQSTPLTGTISDWTSYTVEFATGADTQAVSVGLQRKGCEQAACPVFGRLWLSNFALKRLSGALGFGHPAGIKYWASEANVFVMPKSHA